MSEITVDSHGRSEPPQQADEVETLLGFLDFQRSTFEWRCRGLSDDQLRATLAPTTMTLSGMVKHLALVEDYWCTEVVGQQQPPQPWADVDWQADGDWDWRSATQDSGEELRALWQASLDRSRAVLAARLASSDGDALAQTFPAGSALGRVSLRWVVVHLLEEYARHNGHADLLRESIDGETGE